MTIFWIALAALLALVIAGVLLEQRSGRSFSGGRGGLAGRMKRDAYSGSDFRRDDE